MILYLFCMLYVHGTLRRAALTRCEIGNAHVSATKNQATSGPRDRECQSRGSSIAFRVDVLRTYLTPLESLE